MAVGMTRILCAVMVVLTLATSGCSVGIGLGMAMSADARNRDAVAHGEPAPTSPGKRFLAGFLVGAALDAAVILLAASILEPLGDWGCGHSDC
jgi:hypothetical protein